MKKSKNKNWLKISNYTFSGLAIAGILGGSIFGIYNYSNKNEYQLSEDYKHRYDLHIKVEREGSDKTSMSYIENNINERMDFNGYHQTEVYSLNEDNLVVSIPLDSLNEDDIFAVKGNERFLREMLYVSASAITGDYVEFRTLEGHDLFKSGTNGHPEFNEPELPDEPEEDKEGYIFDDQVEPYKHQLTKSASVKHMNGVPYVELIAKDSRVHSEFIKLFNFMTENELPFAVWFAYDQLEWLAQKVDPDGWAAANNNLYSYAYTDSNGNPTSTPRREIEPFLITSLRPDRPLNIHEQVIPLLGQFTGQKAQDAVQRINFSNKDFKLEIVNTNVVTSNRNDVELKHATWLYITFISVVAFFYVWYAGLLGLIATSGMLIETVAFFGMAAAFNLPASIPLMFTGMMIQSMSTYFMTVYLKLFKENISNKTPWTKYKENVKKVNSQTGLQYWLGLMLLISFSFLTPMNVKAVMLLGASVFSIGMLIILFYVGISITIVDQMTKFSMTKNRKRWSWIVGFDFANSNKEIYRWSPIKKISKRKTLINTGIIFVSLVVVSMGLFGILKATTGKGYNPSYLNNYNYKYEIALVEGKEPHLPWNPEPLDDDGHSDLDGHQDEIDKVNKDYSEIMNVLRDEGINVTDSQLSRKDVIDFYDEVPPDDNSIPWTEWEFKYGFNVWSSTKMSKEQFEAINAELKNVGEEKGYELTETYSAIDITSGEAIKMKDIGLGLANEYGGLTILIAILIALLTMVFTNSWTVSLITMGLVAVEGFATYAIYSIIYAPYTPTLWTGLSMYIMLSMFQKTRLITNAKNRIKMGERKTEAYVNAAARNNVLVILSSVWFTLLSSFLTYFIGIEMLPSTLILIIGSVIMFLSNTYLSPSAYALLIGYREQRDEKIRIRDEMTSKQIDVDEEYIGGINRSENK